MEWTETLYPPPPKACHRCKKDFIGEDEVILLTKLFPGRKSSGRFTPSGNYYLDGDPLCSFDWYHVKCVPPLKHKEIKNMKEIDLSGRPRPD